MENGIFEKIDGYLNKLKKVFETICGLLVAGLTVVVVSEVISRYFLGLPIAITGELTNVMFPWITGLAAIIITINQDNISLVILKDKLSPVPRYIVDIGIYLLCLAYSTMMTYSSVKLSFELKSQRMALLKISKAYLYGAIVIAFVFITLVLCYQMIKRIAQGVEGDGQK